MKRVGPKGGYDFERISWDQALDEIADRLMSIKKDHGPEAAAIYTGRGSFDQAMCDLFQPQDIAVTSASSLLFPYGSPHTMGVGALCYVGFAMIAPHVTMGGMYHYMFPDLDQAELVVIWGTNPMVGSPAYKKQAMLKARDRGARFVVIDPLRTASATELDAEWLAVRPGTDGALALALNYEVIRNGWYDHEFVEEWTHGFAPFADYVKKFTPEYAQEVTGVAATRIRQLAYELAHTQKVAPVMYTGLEYSNSGTQNIRAVFILLALTGHIDQPGGLCFRMPGYNFAVNRKGLLDNPAPGKALGKDQFPIYYKYRKESHAIALPDSVLQGRPYKLRALLLFGTSLITSWPQSELWRQTLAGLDFLVTVDRQLTADSAYADIVLPATTMFEIDSYVTYGPAFRLRERVIDPVGEARSDFFIQAALAERLGYGHLYPQSEEKMLEFALEGSGLSLTDVRRHGGMVRQATDSFEYRKWEKGLLRADGENGFDTPTGKFEIFSTVLQGYGYEPLPKYDEPWESPRSRPDLAEKFPLVFNSGARVDNDFRSQHHGVASLVAEAPAPKLLLHPYDAQERGIVTGDVVELATPRGSVEMVAIVSESIAAGSVEANMGGGGPVGPEPWQKNNINDLTDLYNYDPISGFPVYKALLCDVWPLDLDKKSSPKPRKR
jgi:anaerobic selenocysteine-containing dehydrogenase